MSSKKQLQEKKQQEFKEKEKLRQLGLENILTNENSRKYLWDQLESSFIFDTTFTGNSQTFANEGRRQSGLVLFLDLLDVAPEIFIEMYRKYRREEDV